MTSDESGNTFHNGVWFSSQQGENGAFRVNPPHEVEGLPHKLFLRPAVFLVLTEHANLTHTVRSSTRRSTTECTPSAHHSSHEIRGHAPALRVRRSEFHSGGKPFVVEIRHDRFLLRLELLQCRPRRGQDQVVRNREWVRDQWCSPPERARQCGQRQLPFLTAQPVVFRLKDPLHQVSPAKCQPILVWAALNTGNVRTQARWWHKLRVRVMC